MMRAASYVWTACGACWCIIYTVTGVPEALLVGALCLAVAGLHMILGELK